MDNNHSMLIDQILNEYDDNTKETAKKIAYYYNNIIAYMFSEQQTYLRNLSENSKNNSGITKLINEKFTELKNMDNFENFSKPLVLQVPENAQAPQVVSSAPAAPATPLAPAAPLAPVASAALIVGGRRNNSKYTDISMKYIKSLCKTNQIKLSTTINNKRVTYTKNELITKLKRKKLL
jgi:hypothetical protein